MRRSSLYHCPNGLHITCTTSFLFMKWKRKTFCGFYLFFSLFLCERVFWGVWGGVVCNVCWERGLCPLLTIVVMHSRACRMDICRPHFLNLYMRASNSAFWLTKVCYPCTFAIRLWCEWRRHCTRAHAFMDRTPFQQFNFLSQFIMCFRAYLIGSSIGQTCTQNQRSGQYDECPSKWQSQWQLINLIS